MIIERDLTPYVVYSGDPVLRALEKITANKARVIFLVDAHGHLDGVLSDGDFRRWVSAGARLDIDVPALEAANTNPRSLPVGSSPAEIAHAFGYGIDHVALVDERGHLVAIAINRADEFRIGRHLVAQDAPDLVIAEIGINHQGDIDLAKRLVDEFAAAGADIVKFQLRDMEALYRQGSGGSAGEDLGTQYTLDLLAKYNLDADGLVTVFDHCADIGIDVMCTAWDPRSVDRLVGLRRAVAEGRVGRHDQPRPAAAHGRDRDADGALDRHVHRGRDPRDRRGDALQRRRARLPALPVDLPRALQGHQPRLPHRLAELTQTPVGYSGHERGFHVPVAAVALGARIIEKHVTIDRDLEGNDHKVSLLPREFAEMVQRIREVEEALGTDAPRAVSTGEMMNRINLAKSLVATRRIEVGEVLTADDIDIKSPGRGLQPNALDKLVGRTTSRAFERRRLLLRHRPRRRRAAAVATTTSPALGAGRPLPRHRGDDAGHDPRLPRVPLLLQGPRPARRRGVRGVPRRPADGLHHATPPTSSPATSCSTSPPRTTPTGSARSASCSASSTPPGRCRSTSAAADDRAATRPGDRGQPRRVHHRRLRRARRAGRMYARVAAGLARVDDSGVRLCAQTLPPYPWYMGGQLFCNLFVDPRDTAEFAATYDRRLCFDVSHSKLAANYLGMSFAEATDLLAPHTEHLHLVDATGVDGEGVQVGDGEIDWARAGPAAREAAPGVSFIPEIWQGHVNDGEGFWIALERLEQWF